MYTDEMLNEIMAKMKETKKEIIEKCTKQQIMEDKIFALENEIV